MSVMMRLCFFSAIAHTTRACSSGDAGSPTCFASQSTATSVVSSHSSTESGELEHEEGDDADFTVHMQMRVALDMPANAEHQLPDGTRTKELAQPGARGLSAQRPSAQQSAGSSLPPMVVAKSFARISGDNIALELVQAWTQSMTFIQIATVLGIIVACFLIRALARCGEKKHMKETEGEGQFDPSAKLQQVLCALRFVPQAEDCAQLLPCQSFACEMLPVSEQPEAEVEPEEEAPRDHIIAAIAKQAKPLANETCLAVEACKPQTKPDKVKLKVQVLSC